MEDVLTKATADGVRIYALCTTNLVQEAAKKHGCSHQFATKTADICQFYIFYLHKSF